MIFLIIFGTSLIIIGLIEIFWHKNPKDLTDQVVLVTGGANGLGKEMCIRFAKLACKIAIADLDIENAEKTVKELQAKGCKAAFAYRVDVSSLKEIENLKVCIEKDLGKVDVVVNNAALLYCRSVEEETPEILQKMININTMSLFWTTRVFLPGMKERKRGHIVSIASATALLGAPQLHAYTTSKFAVRGFMESLKVDLSREGHDNFVRLTTAYPWWIDTRPYIRDFTEQMFKFCYKMKPAYVAKVIVEGVRRNEREITIPGILYYFGYLINIRYFVVLGMKFLGKEYKQELDVKYNPQSIL